MIESLPILDGYCTIELKRKISGNNYNPHTIQWEVCGNVLVNEVKLHILRYDLFGNEIRWLKIKDPITGSYYAYRQKNIGGKWVYISMASEILGLPYKVGSRGDVADHKNHDRRDNRIENLRKASPTQNKMNAVRKRSSRYRFKNIYIDGKKWASHINFSKLQIRFPSVLTDIEAGLMYCYAAMIRDDQFYYVEDFPPNEMSPRERRWELFGMVVEKLRLKSLI